MSFGSKVEEKKTFQIIGPEGQLLTSADGETIATVTLWAPQSDRMVKYTKARNQAALMKAARKRGPQDIEDLEKAAAKRLAHQIESWNLFDVDGQPMEKENGFSEAEKADFLLNTDIQWWFTEQLLEYGSPAFFVVKKTKTETTD